VWWSFSARVCVMEKGLNWVCGVREESESPMRVEEELFLTWRIPLHAKLHIIFNFNGNLNLKPNYWKSWIVVTRAPLGFSLYLVAVIPFVVVPIKHLPNSDRRVSNTHVIFRTEPIKKSKMIR
jgi:hypothetical protein